MPSITIRSQVANVGTLLSLITVVVASWAADLIAAGEPNNEDAPSRAVPVKCQGFTVTSEEGVATAVPNVPFAALTNSGRYMACSAPGRDVALGKCDSSSSGQCESKDSRVYPALLSDTEPSGHDLVIYPGTRRSEVYKYTSSYAKLSTVGFESRYVPTYGVARATQADACELAGRFASEVLARACAMHEAWVEVTCHNYVVAEELIVSRQRPHTVVSVSGSEFIMGSLNSP